VDDPAPNGFRPPYLAFKTFWTFIEELTAKPLPPKIDRSLMRSKSGSDQIHLTAAMKAFDLIDNDQRVTGLAGLAATDDEGRIAWLALEIRKRYPDQMQVSADNGTEQQLRDSFKQSFSLESADTVRKAMTFFLHAARTARIEVSTHFPSTRSGSGAPGAPRPRRSARRKAPTPPPKNDSSSENSAFSVSGDVYTLKMASGPTVTLAVQMNVMEASVTDRDFIFHLVDKLRGYSNGERSQTSGSSKETAGQQANDEEDSI
jgi:hypothetical protein